MRRLRGSRWNLRRYLLIAIPCDLFLGSQGAAEQGAGAKELFEAEIGSEVRRVTSSKVDNELKRMWKFLLTNDI